MVWGFEDGDVWGGIRRCRASAICEWVVAGAERNCAESVCVVTSGDWRGGGGVICVDFGTGGADNMAEPLASDADKFVGGVRDYVVVLFGVAECVANISIAGFPVDFS